MWQTAQLVVLTKGFKSYSKKKKKKKRDKKTQSSSFSQSAVLGPDQKSIWLLPEAEPGCRLHCWWGVQSMYRAEF